MGNLVKETPYSEITATLELLDANGVTREHLALLRKNRAKAMTVAHLIMGIIQQTYKVIVDYGLSLAEMIKAGKYGWFNDDITAKNFTLEGSGQHEAELVLVHLNRDATTKEVREYLDEQGLAPAKIEHLLAFGAAYPELQREFPIAALGSSFVRGLGGRSCPCLCCRGVGGRGLDLTWHDGDSPWGGGWRFLALRK